MLVRALSFVQIENIYVTKLLLNGWHMFSKHERNKAFTRKIQCMLILRILNDIQRKSTHDNTGYLLLL